MKNSLPGEKINSIFNLLNNHYGHCGWWPVIDLRKKSSVYHLNTPRSNKEIFEIILGTILTQNVSWKNAEKALYNLKSNGLIDPEKLHETDNEIISELIRSSGYYNQKTIKIKNFLEWFGKYFYSYREIKNKRLEILRNELLNVKGIGSETADSILLYGFNKKIFVIDTYTFRLISRAGLYHGEYNYKKIQDLFHKNFNEDLDGFKNYHALIVEHGKELCRKKPFCNKCFFIDLCERKGV